MVYIASPTLHRSKRSGLVKCHSRRRVCIVCGGKWVEWDVTSGGYEKITRAEYYYCSKCMGRRAAASARSSCRDLDPTASCTAWHSENSAAAVQAAAAAHHACRIFKVKNPTEIYCMHSGWPRALPRISHPCARAACGATSERGEGWTPQMSERATGRGKWGSLVIL